MKWYCPACSKELNSLRGMGGHARRCPVTPDQMFWMKVKRLGNGECWPWLGALQRDGYAHFTTAGRKTISSHRYAYEKLIGPIPEGMDLLHHCDNRICVNPFHTRPGTHMDNMLDKRKRERVWSKLSHNDVRAIRKLIGTKPNTEIAVQFNISPSAISEIKLGHKWSYVT